MERTLGSVAAKVKLQIPEAGSRAIERRTGYPKGLLRKTEEVLSEKYNI